MSILEMVLYLKTLQMSNSPKITAIMATCGRHYCSERSLSLFLNQDYENKHLLIYQNSHITQTLHPSVDRSIVSLVNCYVDTLTNLPYSSLGAIYNDAIRHVPEDTDVITFWDDDDLFLEDHLSEGIKGLLKGGKTAYKPTFSYFRSLNGVEKAQNTFEPSIFVKADFIKVTGFSNTTTDQHLKWLRPLMETNDIFIDNDGKSTLIYNWGDSFATYKTSQNSENPNHFEEYKIYSLDHGDQIISRINIDENF